MSTEYYRTMIQRAEEWLDLSSKGRVLPPISAQGIDDRK